MKTYGNDQKKRLMLCDNCPHFDPKEWLAMQDDPNDDRSLGLRLAVEAAAEMNYTSALGLNIVTIRLQQV